MKRQFLKFCGALAFAALPVAGMAQNPIVQTCYTADPAPMVYGDRFYVYVDEDEGPDYYKMNEWRVYSSADMVNWTDHGTALPLTAFAWASEDSAWASQCIERNGKFYWYVCCTWKETSSSVIGVAVADTPTGPFKDAIGEPLVSGGWGYIDPSPFIDDDGQAYLYFGNPGCFYVKLNEDMISYSGDVVEIEQTEESFGGPKEPEDGVEYTDLYEEGPWICKRDGIYYLLYAAGGVPEYISYSTSDSPEGPWKYQGKIMPLQDTGSFTNHCGVMDFQGHSYFAYHTGWLPGGGGFNRSVCIEEFEYNADGSFPEITATYDGVDPIGTLDPYTRQEAETMAWGLGLETEGDAEQGVYVTSVNNGDSLKVREVDFGSTGAGVLTFSVACATNGGTIEVHADTKDGDLIATLPVSYTGGESTWKEVSTGVSGLTGKHDIWFVFTGDADEDNLFNMDYWMFTETTSSKTLVSLNTVVSEYKIDNTASLGNTSTVTVMAVYSNGETEDVTSEAAITADDEYVTVSGSTITGVSYGESSVTVSYGGLTTTQNIRVRSYNSENTVASVEFEIEDMEDGALLMMPGDTGEYSIIVTYSDGHAVDVTSEVTCTYSEKGYVTFSDGDITAIQDGSVTVSASYQGAVGDEQTATVTVNIETISLDAFDPSIWGDGTYDKTTHSFSTTTWGGFGGWYYSEPQDWSDYGYLTVELEEAAPGDLRFQLWDTESYWNDHASYEMEGLSSLSVNLHSMTLENDTATAVSPETVYRIGFWSTLSDAITIKSVRLEYPAADERISLTDLNPSIYGTGTYDNESYILQTDQYGFGGWEFDPALDLSDYEYLVVNLAEEQSCGAQFRIFDEDNYWSDCAIYDFGSETTLKIDLSSMTKATDTATTVDPSNIRIMGFWSYGGSDIHISSIYLLGGDTNLIENVTILPSSSETVDVYSVTGAKMRSRVSVSDATDGLGRGIYIVGGRKVIVK